MATSTIFNFNFNNSEIVDSTGQWYNATTGTPTTEFIEHDGNTALLQRAFVDIAGTPYLRDINPVFFQSRDPTFTAHTYTIELQIYPLRDSGGYGPWGGPVLDFNPTESDERGYVRISTIQQRASESNTFYWREYGLGPDGAGIPFLTVTAADGTYNRWYSIRIERVDDGTNTGATVKIYVDGTLVANETLTYPQDARRGRIGDSIRYTYGRNSTDPQGAGVAIDNFKLTAGIAPSSVVDVSLANLQRNNANLLSFIKGKVPTVNDGTLTIKVNGVTAGTFTANQSTAATANIQCVDLTSAQTIAGDKDFTGTTGTRDVIPATTDTYDLGSSAKEYNNAYVKALTVNGTAAGDILTHNASEFIPVTGGAVMAGQTFARTNTTSFTSLCGGTAAFSNGGEIDLYGADSAANAGAVVMRSYPTGNTIYFNGDGLWCVGELQLGKSDRRWGQIYSTNATISTSDSRLKNSIKDIDDKLLDAWENIEPKQYKFNDATEKKGEKARYHTGYLAQDIQAECEKQGINASDYGLFCYDEWEDQEEVSEEIETEKDGKIVKEKRVIQPKREKGNSYALRYEEALIVECKYLRRCIERLTARIEQLEKEREASK